MDKITFSQYVVMWLSGYYNGKRNNTIIDPDAVKKNEGEGEPILLSTPRNNRHGRCQERARL